MRVLLIPVGTAGDVHPHVGLALALRGRGHDVTLATSAYFSPLIERLGLPYVPLGTAEQYETLTEVAAFLDAPDPPVVFVAGTACEVMENAAGN